MKTIFSEIAESIALTSGAMFRTSLPSYCCIETADSDTALVTKRGALISGIRVDGSLSAIGPDEFESIVEGLTRALQSCLTNQGHTIDVFASRDTSGVQKKLANMSDGIRKTCSKIGLDMEDVIASNEAELSKYAAEESVYIVIWTRESVQTKTQAEHSRKEMLEASLKMPKIKASAQQIISTASAVRERHEATVSSILEDIKRVRLQCELLTCHEMLRIARMQIDPTVTPADWLPQLVGDKMPLISGTAYMRDESATELDMSDIQYPPVAWQLFPRDAKRINAKYVEIGDYVYAPVFVEIPPREILPFSTLFEKLASEKIPWRVMFRIDGGGMKYVGTKAALAQLLAITSSFNKRISDAVEDLKAVEFKSNTLVRMRINFCTWAPAGNVALLARRSSFLAQMVSAWGQCEVREVSGDSMLGAISSVPFISEESAAQACVAPLAHVARMLPIMRPASPWRTGAIIYRTMDGRLMPFQPGSSIQTTWNYILFGRPGFGKSVQMLNLILGSCMQPGLNRLPRVGIVDIGASSQYFVNMIKASLPLNIRHMVAGFKLSMSPEHAINPFDLPLGCRFPTPEHKAFMVNIITQLATPAEADAPYARISELVSQVVDAVYDKMSGESASSTPRRYSANVEVDVDEALYRLGFAITRDTIWWHIVDFLADKGMEHLATLAQRHAVPTVTDCVDIPKSVNDIYGKIKIAESGETLTEAFTSLLSSATRDYPNLSMPTRFDIGEVRVAAINLEDVAKTGSAAAEKQTAVMYMLASYALTKDYRFNEDDVRSMRMPKMYMDYHIKRARETKEDLKWIAYDEFHRTSKSQAVQDSVLVDMREGRKYKIGVILSSQGAVDFPAVMKEFATGTFIVDAGSKKNVDALQNYFGLNDTARRMLVEHVNGPKSSGAPLLAVLATKGGPYVQLLVSTLGISTRWALSTTAEDVVVRERVCARLGQSNGRTALARAYPDMAQKAVEVLREAGDSDPITTVSNQVLSDWASAKK